MHACVSRVTRLPVQILGVHKQATNYTKSIWMSNVENNSFIVNIIHHNMYILETCNFVISEMVSQTELYNKTI